MINKKPYSRVVVVALSIVFAVFLVPTKSQALLGIPTTLPFGGYVLFSIPCTCPPGSTWIFYTPLFNGSSIPISGALIYTPVVSKLYLNFNPGMPTTWELGSYTPGLTSCMIGVPPACSPLPALGTIKMMGSSLPGALP